MASFQSQPSKLFARDIARFSDSELDQYLKANRGEIDVEDYENLRNDKVLIQRLRMRARAGATTQSCPIDLDDLTTRLEDISTPRKAQLRSPPPYTAAIQTDESKYDALLGPRASDFRSRETTESFDEEVDNRLGLEYETECYNALISEGGRPSHPVSLGRNILEDPGEYREILSYWQLNNGDAEGRVWKVFKSQLCDWLDFRRWQRKNREEGRFPKYVKGVKGGLAEHGFSRSFELDEDAERQDKLTTWIEYLDFEYWWYDKDMRFVKRHQPRYDEAWKKLADSKVLRPFETEEFVNDIKSAFQRSGEENRVRKSMKSARLAVISAQNVITNLRHSSISEREPRQQLAAAQSKLDEIKETLKSMKRRDDLIYEFKKKTRNYQIVRKNAERRSILLRWILQQVPLIERELNLVKVAENDSNGLNDGKQRSKRNRADESNEERVLKRQRKNGEISDRTTRASITKEGAGQLKRSYHKPLKEGQVSKRPKCNDQNPSFSPHETSDTSDPTPIGEPVAIQPLKTQDSEATAAKSAKAHSIRHFAPKKKRPEANIPAEVVLDGKARVVKRGRGGGKFGNLSTLGSPPLRRRSTRMRKPPGRFQ